MRKNQNDFVRLKGYISMGNPIFLSVRTELQYWENTTQVIQTQQGVQEQVTPIQANISVRWPRNSNCLLVFVPVCGLWGLQPNTRDVYTVNRMDCFKKDAKRWATSCLKTYGFSCQFWSTRLQFKDVWLTFLVQSNLSSMHVIALKQKLKDFSTIYQGVG